MAAYQPLALCHTYEVWWCDVVLIILSGNWIELYDKLNNFRARIFRQFQWFMFWPSSGHNHCFTLSWGRCKAKRVFECHILRVSELFYSLNYDKQSVKGATLKGHTRISTLMPMKYCISISICWSTFAKLQSVFRLPHGWMNANHGRPQVPFNELLWRLLLRLLLQYTRFKMTLRQELHYVKVVGSCETGILHYKPQCPQICISNFPENPLATHHASDARFQMHLKKLEKLWAIPIQCWFYLKMFPINRVHIQQIVHRSPRTALRAA